MTARHIPDGQIPKAENLADGTGAKRYQPLPGDVVDVDVRGIPALKIYGTRVGVIRKPTQAHGADFAWVTLPGFEHDELVEVDWLTLVHRRAP